MAPGAGPLAVHDLPAGAAAAARRRPPRCPAAGHRQAGRARRRPSPGCWLCSIHALGAWRGARRLAVAGLTVLDRGPRGGLLARARRRPARSPRPPRRAPSAVTGAPRYSRARWRAPGTVSRVRPRWRPPGRSPAPRVSCRPGPVSRSRARRAGPRSIEAPGMSSRRSPAPRRGLLARARRRPAPGCWPCTTSRLGPATAARRRLARSPAPRRSPGLLAVIGMVSAAASTGAGLRGRGGPTCL